jgi:hypothetical protein
MFACSQPDSRPILTAHQFGVLDARYALYICALKSAMHRAIMGSIVPPIYCCLRIAFLAADRRGRRGDNLSWARSRAIVIGVVI